MAGDREDLFTPLAGGGWRTQTVVERRFENIDQVPQPIGPQPTPRLLFRRSLRLEDRPRVRPGASVLEGFLGLVNAEDEEIFQFSKMHGPLLAFAKVSSDIGEPAVHTEACETWRYFATVMNSILRISASIYGNENAKANDADWRGIGKVPEAMSRHLWEVHDQLVTFGRTRDEIFWVHFCTIWRDGVKTIDRRRALTDLVNGLLRLGQVQVSFGWPQRNERATLSYSGQCLLGFVALQIALRATKADAPTVCFHCRKEFTPTKRAAKNNQRSFCPDCREEKWPVTYAVRDHRDRNRG